MPFNSTCLTCLILSIPLRLYNKNDWFKKRSGYVAIDKCSKQLKNVAQKLRNSVLIANCCLGQIFAIEKCFLQFLIRVRRLYSRLRLSQYSVWGINLLVEPVYGQACCDIKNLDYVTEIQIQTCFIYFLFVIRLSYCCY